MATDYATLADVRASGNYAEDETKDNAQIESLITQVSRFFDRYTGRVLVPDADKTEYFTYEEHVLPYSQYNTSTRARGYDLFLGEADNPLLSITTLTNADGNTIANTEYFLLPRGADRYHTIRLKEASTYSWEDDTDGYISVAGRWGWATSIPDDIRLACVEAVLYIHNGRNNIADYERPQVSQSGIMLLPKMLPQRVLETLNWYRKKI